MTTTTCIPPLIVDRSLAVYHFEGGGFVAVVTGGKVQTCEAIEMARVLLGLKADEVDEAQAMETRRAETERLGTKPDSHSPQIEEGLS